MALKTVILLSLFLHDHFPLAFSNAGDVSYEIILCTSPGLCKIHVATTSVLESILN